MAADPYIVVDLDATQDDAAADANLAKFKAKILELAPRPGLPNGGGVLLVPPGTFKVSDTLTLNQQFVIRGAGVGRGRNAANPQGTTLLFPAGKTGLIIDIGKSFGVIEDIAIESENGGATLGLDEGIEIRSSYTRLSRVRVIGFGRSGIF